MKKSLLLVLIILSVFFSGCDLYPHSGFFSTNSIDGLYISRSNGMYIGDRLSSVYGIIKNSSPYLKDFVEIQVILKDRHGNHLNTYTKSFGPIESGKDIPMWIHTFPVNEVYVGYELEIVEAKEFHNIPSSEIGYFQGYHDFSFTVSDSSWNKSDVSSLWEYSVKVIVANDNNLDLSYFYCESLLYSTNGLIAGFKNSFVSMPLKAGESTEVTFTYLLKEYGNVYSIDFWGSSYATD